MLLTKFKYSLFKNAKIKLRSKKQLAMELFYPLLFVAMSLLVSMTSPAHTFAGVPSMDSTPISSAEYGGNSIPTMYLPYAGPYMCLFQQDMVCPNMTSPPNIFAYAPSTTLVTSVMNSMKTSLSEHLGPIALVPYSSVEQLDIFMRNHTTIYDIGVFFNFTGPSLPNDIKYSIKLSDKRVPPISTTADPPEGCRPKYGHFNYGSMSGGLSDTHLPTYCSGHQYLNSMVIAVQTALDETLINMKTGSTLSLLSSVSVKQMPLGAATLGFGIGSSGFFALYLPFGLAFFCQYLLQYLVEEKEKRVRETLRLMGLPDLIMWLSWFVSFAMSQFVVAIITAILSTTIGFFSKTAFTLVLLMICLYQWSLITFGFMISSFFGRVKTAGAVGILLVIITIVGYVPWVIDNTLVAPTATVILSLLPGTALCFAQSLLFKAEAGYHGLSGIGWGDIGVDVDGYNLGTVLVMMCVGCVVQLLVAWYLDHIIPSANGTALSPLFCFKRSYWCQQHVSKQGDQYMSTLKQVEEGSQPLLTDGERLTDREDESAFRDTNCLTLHGLSKTFPDKKGDVVAVDDVTFSAYEGQIFALLGHNGSGKTTTLNMLVGQLQPSEGHVTIFGRTIQHDRGDGSIGVCPQTSVSVEKLTVMENIELLAAIKGVPSSDVHSAAITMVDRLGLGHRCDAMPPTLSGGEQRKLSLAMAMVGDPKVVVLDEPTTGMDPAARLEVWDMLKECKSGRVVLLSTHFMDEADVLADRKGILVNGTLRCIGSSLFLKNKFGIGHSLNCTVTDDGDSVSNYVLSSVEGSTVERRQGDTIEFKLPFNAARALPLALKELEENKDKYSVGSIGLSAVTLEEVFMRFAEDDDDSGGDTVNESVSGLKPAHTLPASAWRHVKAMAMACWLNTRRGGWLHYTAPLVIVLIALMMQVQGAAIVQSWHGVLGLTVDTAVATRQTVFPIAVDGVSSNVALSLMDRAVGVMGSKCWSFSCLVNGLDEYLYGQASSGWKGQSGQWMIGAIFSDIGMSALEYTVLFDAHQPHAVPATIATINDAFMRQRTNNVSSLHTTIEPLQSNSIEFLFNVGSQMLFIGLALVPAILTSDIVKDKEKKIKHLLRVNGMKTLYYWLGNGMYHMIVLMLFGVVSVIVIVAGSFKPLCDTALLPFLILLPLWMLTTLLFDYVLSLLFKSSAMAYPSLVLTNELAAVIPGTAVMILTAFMPSIGITVHLILAFVLPPYSLFGATTIMGSVASASAMRVAYGGQPASIGDYFAADGVWELFLLLPVQAVLLLAGLVWADGRSLESSTGLTPHTPHDVDRDVARERERVMNAAADANVIVDNVFKSYGPIQAVNGVSFMLDDGEIFGLLGPNGVGKSTTVNMITRDVKPTSGVVRVCGVDMKEDAFTAFQHVGLCSQDNALWDYLTASDHLKLFGHIKNISDDDVSNRIQYLSNTLDLTDHLDKQVRHMSGGQKRKLCVAIALISSPRVLILDEPSSGLDVAARRKLWSMIRSYAKECNATVLLTTHIMSEADNLCSRIGIMVKGRLECLGSPQHLKSRYGQTMKLHISVPLDKYQELKLRMSELFPTAVLEEAQHGKMTFSLPICDVPLWQAFDHLESNKDELNIGEYSISQTSLDQVYLKIVADSLNE